MNQSDKKLTILGGGITGMSAAYIAARDGWKVTIIEGSPQLGGLLRTFQISGNRLEQYYHHHFTNDAELLWLLDELGIKDNLQFHKTTMGIFRDNRIFDFNTASDLLKFTPMKPMDKLRFIASSAYLGKVARWRRLEHIPALNWFYKHAGKRATETVWRPLLDIKFGPYAEDIPAAWMVGRLKQRMNSRKGNEEHLGYIKGSLQALLDTLAGRLEEMGVKIILNARLERMRISRNTLTGIETSQGSFEGGVFLATIPTTYLSGLLKNDAPLYAEALSRIEYIGAVCTILEMDRPLSDIYWLNIADPGFPFGGIIEHTNFIPAEEYGGSHIIYLSRYFARNDQLASVSKREIISQMLKPIKRINPRFSQSWIKNVYVFRSNMAATVCGLNFSRYVPDCKTPINNLYLANMSHIYPDERSCNNSIRVAAQACKKIGIDSSMVPFGSSLSGQIGMD